MDINKIRETATVFRNAIEVCAPSLGVIFKKFPSGACGEAVLLLGTYLIEQDLGEFQYMLGDYGARTDSNWSSHAWLQADNLVVDITADQFPEVNEKVVVQDYSKWHAKLNGKSLHIADYRILNTYTVSSLNGMYRKIIAVIKAQA
ncbi:MAG TPA: hypothetical protein ENN95_02400 [Deltaproteobacteria bacterium]|nr:hypothetical protein [Deltaproteobacteria bacterium]